MASHERYGYALIVGMFTAACFPSALWFVLPACFAFVVWGGERKC